MTNLLQIKLNHARQAQDIGLQRMVETVGNCYPFRTICCTFLPCWSRDSTGRAAIIWKPMRCLEPIEEIDKGNSFVAMRFGTMLVYFFCYISQNCSILEFENFLQNLKINIE